MEPAFFKTIFSKLKKLIQKRTGKIRKINFRNFHVKIFFPTLCFHLKTGQNSLPSRKCGQTRAVSKSDDCIQAKRSIHCIFNHRRVQIEWKSLKIN
jgi:hypothetical protein